MHLGAHNGKWCNGYAGNRSKWQVYIPALSRLRRDGHPQASQSYGYYWSSTPGEEYGYLSYGLLIKYDKREHFYRDWRYMGFSVRAVKDKNI